MKIHIAFDVTKQKDNQSSITPMWISQNLERFRIEVNTLLLERWGCPLHSGWLKVNNMTKEVFTSQNTGQGSREGATGT